MSPKALFDRDWAERDPQPDDRPKRLDRRSVDERDREAFGEAADRIADALPPLSPARIVQCDPAWNGHSRTSKCARVEGGKKCSACVYAERSTADDIAENGWCPVEWEP